MEELSISEIEIVILPSFKGGLIGFGSLLLGGKLKIGNLAIRNRLNGGPLRVVYPGKKLSDGRHVYSVCPIESGLAKAIEEAFTDKYQELMNR